jgi:glutathione S-transferase
MASTLYITDLSPFGARVRLVCLFTGVNFEELSPPGGAGSDTMKAISPFGKMPAIALDDRVLVESLALMEYVVDKVGGSPLMPPSPERRAAIRGLMLAHDHYVMGAIWPMFLQLRTGKPDPAICRSAMDAADVQYGVLTRLFDEGTFALGGELSLADIAMAPLALLFTRLYPAFGSTAPFKVQHRLMRWWEAVSDVPEMAEVFSRMDAAIARAFGKT